MRLFRTRDDFELDNPHRGMSLESDYGYHWRTSAVPNVRWRVSYIKDTGEIYAIAATRPFEVWLMGHVRVGIGPDWARPLDEILTGWTDPRISAFDLDWIANKLASVGATA
jgi:hypothetical protein